MLSVAGLVFIPGMMTGQILAGGDAITAAKYQIMIMFGIAASSTSATIIAVGVTLRALMDENHRLRIDRLTDRQNDVLYNLWCAFLLPPA
jgi:putative ABC transport system permease protein